MKFLRKPVHQFSRKKEAQSKRAFEAFTRTAFFIHGWHQRDWGADAVVGILQENRDPGEMQLESALFLVQVKSMEEVKRSGDSVPVKVPVHKLKYWNQSPIPVLLLLYDLHHACFYRQWIDETLLARIEAQNPGWSAQRFLTFHVPANAQFSEASLAAVREYVLSEKANP